MENAARNGVILGIVFTLSIQQRRRSVMHTQIEERQSERRSAGAPVRRGIWIVAIVLLIGLAVLVVVAAREWPFTRETVIKSLRQQAGSAVQIGNFRETYFPHPGCIAENVTFRQDPSAPALITIQTLTIVGSYHGLLTRHLDTVRAEGFRLVVSQQAAPGSLENLGKTGLSIGQLVADGAEIEFPSQQPGKAPLVFRIPKLDLYDVADSRPLNFQTTVQLPEPPAEVEVAGQFGPWQSGQAGQTNLSGSYAVRNLDLGKFGGIAGKLEASGKFGGELQAVKVQGTLDAPDFEVRQSKHPVHLAALYQATVDGLNGDVDIDAARAHFRNTTIVGAGSVSGQGNENGKTATVELSSKQARIEDLLWMFLSNNPPAMAGPILFRDRVEIPSGNTEFTKRVKLQGDFGISNAQYPNPQTQKTVDVLSADARGNAGKTEATDNKLGNDTYDPGKVLSDVKGHVSLSDGIAHLANVSFDVPGASAQVSGTYSLLNEGINLQGHLHMEAELSQTTTGVKSFLLKVVQPFMHKSKKNESVLAIRIGGTYNHPTYAVVPKAEK